jgi:uncharacterized membrane protein
MALEDSVSELQQIADYWKARKTLRAAGIGGLLFGVLAIVMGAVGLQESILNLILILIGMFLLGEGIFNLVMPTADGIVVDGIGLVVVGLWNAIVNVRRIQQREPP